MITYKRLENPEYISGESLWLNRFLAKRQYYWSATGRGALDYLINNQLKNKPSGVFLPTFVAEGIILPFENNNIPIVYYKLNSDLSPNIEFLTELIKGYPDASIMVAIHYFGIEIRNFDDVCNLARDRGISVVEDCAQALGSKGRDGRYLGSRGDVALFSFPKTVPVPYGCLIMINNPSILRHGSDTIQYRKTVLSNLALIFHRSAISIQGMVLRNNRAVILLMQTISKLSYYIYYKLICIMKNPAPMDPASMRSIKCFKYDEMIQQRYRNAVFLHDNLPQNVRLLHSLYEGLVMTGYPILIENRDIVKKFLKNRFIESLAYTKSWNYIPKKDLSRFQNEVHIFSHHLLLPISENHTLNDMAKIVECLKEFIHEYSN